MIERDRAFAELPVRPDRWTGEPRPPRAPRKESSADGATPFDRERKGRPAPAGLGAVLEWNQESGADATKAGAIGMGLVVAFFTVRDGGVGWMSDWIAWLYAAFAGVVMWWAYLKHWVAAGADWVQQKKKWVNTYELTLVREGVFAAVNRGITLIDADGRRVDLNLKPVQSNPAMWDLVYNGIRHSVVSGDCEISESTCRMLDIPTEFATPDTGYSVTWLLVRLGFFGIVAAFGVVNILAGETRVIQGLGVFCIGLSLWVSWKFIVAYRESNRSSD